VDFIDESSVSLRRRDEVKRRRESPCRDIKEQFDIEGRCAIARFTFMFRSLSVRGPIFIDQLSRSLHLVSPSQRYTGLIDEVHN
jgi:hypothetical protein